ncbi:MAG: methyltransferase domain-containing protein [Rhodospirillaceae bacterium]
MAWDPRQYAAFADERARPAWDLMARIPLEAAAYVADLGCGPGHQAAALARRFPMARVAGVDASPEMLAAAERTVAAELAPTDAARVNLVFADVAAWTPPTPPDVIYSNALLQWLDHHETLLPRLVGLLAPGGVLAVQMPRNHGEASHTAMTEVAADPRWAARLSPHLRPGPVAAPTVYDALLAPLCSHVEVWETVYFHHLTGPDPVLAWVKGTALRPLLAALATDADRAAFEAAYAEKMRAAYPPRADGVTLFPFRRVFFVAVKG